MYTLPWGYTKTRMFWHDYMQVNFVVEVTLQTMSMA